MSTPEHILLKIRQRMDLGEDEGRLDHVINDMPPIQKLRAVIGWELGNPHWADVILEWARDCGFEISEPDGR